MLNDIDSAVLVLTTHAPGTIDNVIYTLKKSKGYSEEVAILDAICKQLKLLGEMIRQKDSCRKCDNKKECKQCVLHKNNKKNV